MTRRRIAVPYNIVNNTKNRRSIAYAIDIRGPARHRPQRGDLLRELFTAYISRGGDQCLLRLVPRESIAEPPEQPAARGVFIGQQVYFRGNTMTHDAAIVARQDAEKGVSPPV
jgi:hypothetical protein